jgi:hypothetical protein
MGLGSLRMIPIDSIRNLALLQAAQLFRVGSNSGAGQLGSLAALR